MKICIIIGARPQYIKAAMLLQAIEKKEQIEPFVIHTGQHYDYNMFNIFFTQLNVKPPDVDLKISKYSSCTMVGKMMVAIENSLKDKHPDSFLVFGDTDSGLAGALSASKLQIPLIHVEAGLRCHNKRVPEEINRILIDEMADLLFCYGSNSVKALGDSNGVYDIGDITYDAFLKSQSKIPEGVPSEKYYLATIHRAENVHLEKLLDILKAIRKGVSDELVVMPLHPNTRKILGDEINQFKNFKFLDPVSYFEMLVLEKNAVAVITDSGGVQKEAFWFGVPCITLRNETEEIDTVINGGNTLVGAEPRHIIEVLQNIKPFFVYKKDLERIYGNGTVAEQIIERILECDLH